MEWNELCRLLGELPGSYPALVTPAIFLLRAGGGLGGNKTYAFKKEGKNIIKGAWEVPMPPKKAGLPAVLTSKRHPVVQNNFSLSGQQSMLPFPGRQFHFQSPLCCSFKEETEGKPEWVQGALWNQPDKAYGMNSVRHCSYSRVCKSM